jgi:hypothetical protein
VPGYGHGGSSPPSDTLNRETPVVNWGLVLSQPKSVLGAMVCVSVAMTTQSLAGSAHPENLRQFRTADKDLCIRAPLC